MKNINLNNQNLFMKVESYQPLFNFKKVKKNSLIHYFLILLKQNNFLERTRVLKIF